MAAGLRAHPPSLEGQRLAQQCSLPPGRPVPVQVREPMIGLDVWKEVVCGFFVSAPAPKKCIITLLFSNSVFQLTLTPLPSLSVKKKKAELFKLIDTWYTGIGGWREVKREMS